jgi:hypothetical protein
MVQQVSRSGEDIATGPSILGDVAKSDHNVLSVESRPSAPAFLRPPVMEPACSACRGTSDLSLAQFQIAAKIGGRLGGNAQPFRRHNERSTEARLRQLAKHTAHFLRGGEEADPLPSVRSSYRDHAPHSLSARMHACHAPPPPPSSLPNPLMVHHRLSTTQEIYDVQESLHHEGTVLPDPVPSNSVRCPWRVRSGDR